MRISAIIFDLNGTVLNDEGVYDIAFNSILRSLGVDTSKPFPHERGIGVKENWVLLMKNLNIISDKTPEFLAAETQKEYLKNVNGTLVRPGFDEFIEDLKGSGVKVGLATSNTWEITMEVLEKTDLIDVFDSVTTTEEVQFNKPDPALFIIAADKLGTEIGECLVIEDAPSGVAAARNAGMKVIAIADDDEYAKLLEKADLVVEGFSDITPKVISDL